MKTEEDIKKEIDSLNLNDLEIINWDVFKEVFSYLISPNLGKEEIRVKEYIKMIQNISTSLNIDNINTCAIIFNYLNLLIERVFKDLKGTDNFSVSGIFSEVSLTKTLTKSMTDDLQKEFEEKIENKGMKH